VRDSGGTQLNDAAKNSELFCRNSLVETIFRCVVGSMGHCKGKDNAKKTAARRRKMERLRDAKAPLASAAKAK
jgi:hypothetical protein